MVFLSKYDRSCDWCDPDSFVIGQEWADMAWVVPSFTKRKVDEAGCILAADPFWNLQREEELGIINNWRSSHSYPLQVSRSVLAGRARHIDGTVIIAQRLKRLPSILAKLRREPRMKLSQMQDMGGCRAVLHTVDQVKALVSVYEKHLGESGYDQPGGPKKFDYITEPKPDGYRSIHYVYRYKSKSLKRAPYNGLRIEIQLRSRLQHLWATAVETVSSFTRQDLKVGGGDASWKRFFALMGSEIALREGCSTVPDTPSTRGEVGEELQALLEQYQLDAILDGFGVAAEEMEGKAERAYAFLIELHVTEQKGIITPLDKPREYAEVTKQYSLLEKKYSDNPDVQVALVSVDSLADLRRAYPNFYLDIGEFLAVVQQAVPR